MSSQENPFQAMGGARPQQPNPVPKLIAVAVVLVLLCAGGGVLVSKVKNVHSPLARGIYGNGKDEAREVKDDDLWTEYRQDDEVAGKKYGDHWVVVSGECAQPESFRPDGSALNEQVSLEIGKRRTQFNVEWKVLCKVPPANAKTFMELQEGTRVRVRGLCKGMKGEQVVLEECELVWKGLAP